MTNRINLKKGYVMLDMLVFKEKDSYIAYLPALNLTSHSKKKETAISMLDNAVQLFFKHWNGKNKLDEKLYKLGWKPEPETHQLRPVKENMNIPYTLLEKNFKRQPYKLKPAVS